MAAAGFDQARQTFERLLACAHQTAGAIEERGATVRAGAGDIGAKAISYAEKNLQTSLDFAQALKARDLTEMMRLHSEFIQAQMRSPAEQASKMGQDVSRAAMDAASRKDDVFQCITLKGERLVRGIICRPPRRRLGKAHLRRVWHAALHLKLHCNAQN